jgi:hypothetical protein
MSFGDGIVGYEPDRLISDEAGNYYLIYIDINNQSGVLKIDFSGNSNQILYKETDVAYYEFLAIVGDYLYAPTMLVMVVVSESRNIICLAVLQRLSLRSHAKVMSILWRRGLMASSMWLIVITAKMATAVFIVKEYANGSWSILERHLLLRAKTLMAL